MSSEDDLMGEVEDLNDLEGDLFGDDEDGGAAAEKEQARELSDNELDSGDDEGRDDRAAEKAEDDDGPENRTAVVQEATCIRHPVPSPSDGEFNILRLPSFLGIDPEAYDPETFKIPTTDHHKDTKSANFSANATAASTMRFRKTASGDFESNTVIHRWSDGSTTISIGDSQYELQSKPLVPSKNSPYQEVQDSHYYLADPSLTSQMILLIGHLSNQYTVRPNKDIADDALEKLQRGMAAATRGRKGDNKGGPELITNTQDPELQKKQAELAEKERMKAQRRRETAAEKANMPGGMRRAMAGGLSIDDLEGSGGRRSKAPPGRRAPKQKRSRKSDYDTDDEDGPRRRNGEDEYDKHDDFLASSDEDLDEIGLPDDDEEEMESDREERRSKKRKTSRPEASDADVDAEGEVDDTRPAAEPSGGGRRKRNIIEDSD